MSSLAGNVAIVTGAGRGIGREIALTLAHAGAIVVAADVDSAGVSDTASIARESSPASICRELDISSVDQIQQFTSEVAERFGAIDVLVNNAGVTRKIDFFDVTAKDMDWITGVNVRGTFFMMQAAAREMQKKGAGRIVNISSIAGKGYKNTTNICYASSKGAIVVMSRIAAAQLGVFGITVNTVCPGMTETEMMIDWMDQRAAEGKVSREAIRSELTKDIALRRTNTVADVAKSVLFLVSPDSRNITGQSLNVDGGIMWD